MLIELRLRRAHKRCLYVVYTLFIGSITTRCCKEHGERILVEGQGVGVEAEHWRKRLGVRLGSKLTRIYSSTCGTREAVSNRQD
jgi:hypothetical protein